MLVFVELRPLVFELLDVCDPRRIGGFAFKRSSLDRQAGQEFRGRIRDRVCRLGKTLQQRQGQNQAEPGELSKDGGAQPYGEGDVGGAAGAAAAFFFAAAAAAASARPASTRSASIGRME